jgi:hypothetical protein
MARRLLRELVGPKQNFRVRSSRPATRLRLGGSGTFRPGGARGPGCPKAAIPAVPARLLLLCLVLRSSWLTVEGGRHVGAAGGLHRQGGWAAVAVSVGVAGGVPTERCRDARGVGSRLLSAKRERWSGSRDPCRPAGRAGAFRACCVGAPPGHGAAALRRVCRDWAVGGSARSLGRRRRIVWLRRTRRAGGASRERASSSFALRSSRARAQARLSCR